MKLRSTHYVTSLKLKMYLMENGGECCKRETVHVPKCSKYGNSLHYTTIIGLVKIPLVLLCFEE